MKFKVIVATTDKYIVIMALKINNFHCSAVSKILKRKKLKETSCLCWIIKQFYTSGLKRKAPL